MIAGLFSPDGSFNAMISMVSDYLWTYLLLGVLIFCGLYFTIRSRFVQFRMVGDMFRLLRESGTKKNGEKYISSFQAFAVSVATRVGTGNLAGVATAIAIGGPGAVFWMWVISLIGSATSFVESTLAQLYKRRIKDSFIGGPAYYILYGMHNKWMSMLFAILITLTFGLVYNSIQSNTICGAWETAFGIDHTYMGIGLTALALFIVFGGIQRIARVSSIVVPLMAIGYFILAIVIVLMNITAIPHIFKLIFENAFGFGQFAGGGIGATMLAGIKRGLFSNEAGEGSSPNAAATAYTSHPVKQGLIQALGVFTDTLLVCSCTAFIILISGIYNTPDISGIVLTQNALSTQIGSAGIVFVAIAILLFAFSSIIGNYYYGEVNVRFMTSNRLVLTAYRIMSAGVMVMFGAEASLDVVWNMGDVFMGCLTACNLVAIVTLGKYAFRLLDDYRKQKKEGKDPHFDKSQMPEIADDIPCW